MTLPRTEKKALWLAVASLVVYLSPLYVLGQDAHIRVHDNLDSNIAWYKVLINSGQWFGPLHSVIPQIMNGIQRNTFGTEFSGIVLLHSLFPSMVAYAVSQTIARVFAFLGMYLLLRDHWIKGPDGTFIRVGVALAFSLTPFWPSGMLSTLGQPLALWSFLHVRNGRGTWKILLPLLLLPLYSSLVLGFFFFLTAMGVLWVWDLITKKRWNVPFLLSIVLMGCLFLAVEYRLLLSLVLSDEPSSRNEFVSSRLTTWRSARLAVKNFVLGHNHVMTVHGVVILPLSIIVMYLCAAYKSWRNEAAARTFMLLFVLSFLTSVWYAFWFHKGWQPLKEQFQLLNTFNFARFHFLRPLFIYSGFALACWMLWRKAGSKGKVLARIAILAQIFVLFMFNEEIVYRDKPSFEEFYAEDQFREIYDYIGLPAEAYRVASIGLHPAVAQYNGFYTVDSYNNFYALQYKHEFREIIAGELAKSKKLRTYFDTWGGRCYIFVAELGKKYEYRKTSKKKVRNLSLDTDSFKRLGGKYILSAVPIGNASANGMILRHVFEHEQSAWRVHLYEVQ
jgi:hypothetical protein